MAVHELSHLVPAVGHGPNRYRVATYDQRSVDRSGSAGNLKDQGIAPAKTQWPSLE
jgi:hypothetical protein